MELLVDLELLVLRMFLVRLTLSGWEDTSPLLPELRVKATWTNKTLLLMSTLERTSASSPLIKQWTLSSLYHTPTETLVASLILSGCGKPLTKQFVLTSTPCLLSTCGQFTKLWDLKQVKT